MAAVELEAVQKSYGEALVLAGASLSIAAGEFVTLLGPSGCGKTTLLRIIAGLATPDSGVVRIGGGDVTTLPVHKREIGMVFQAHALFPHMNVSANVGFGLRMRGVGGEEQRQRVTAALATVRLAEYANRMPHELSGGQQQRVAIARAIVIRPRVLLLDEPFGALDRKLREALQVELREVTRSLGITAVFVTHDQEEALVLSDRIVVMNAGRLEQTGAPGEIFEAPRSRFVADFMGFANLLRARVLDRTADELHLDCDGVRLIASGAASAAGKDEALDIGIRRERIRITPDNGGGDVTNSVAGRIESRIYHGNLWSYRVATPMGSLHVASAADAPDASLRLETGSNVRLHWDRSAVKVFA